MISRRMLRAKVLQTLYAYHQRKDKKVENAEKELFHAAERYYDLYLLIIQLLIDINDYAGQRIELAKRKQLASEADLHPNQKFINNRIINKLKHNSNIQKALRQRGVSWVDSESLIKGFYQNLIHSEAYDTYMNNETDSLEHDKNIIYHILAEELFNSEALYQELEKRSIYWNGDIEYALVMVMKTIEKINSENEFKPELFPVYKDNEDKEFARKLLAKSILEESENRELIEKFTRKWDIERLAYVDLLILIIGISEVKHFPSIPVKVSFNEYIELAKYFGTEKSGTFINGVLDSVVEYMRKNEMFEKKGRGLIGNE